MSPLSLGSIEAGLCLPSDCGSLRAGLSLCSDWSSLKTGLCPVTSLEAEPSTGGPQGHSSEGGGNTRALEPGLLTAGPISQGDSSRLGLYHL